MLQSGRIHPAPEEPIAIRRLITAAVLVLLGSSLSHAQEACPMEQLKDPKLTLSDMYTKAEGKAKAWKADAVPARITNTSLGPLDEQGKSEAWNLMFYSPSANANVTINTFRGMFTCFAQAGTAGRLPDLNRPLPATARSSTRSPRKTAARTSRRATTSRSAPLQRPVIGRHLEHQLLQGQQERADPHPRRRQHRRSREGHQGLASKIPSDRVHSLRMRD